MSDSKVGVRLIYYCVLLFSCYIGRYRRGHNLEQRGGARPHLLHLHGQSGERVPLAGPCRIRLRHRQRQYSYQWGRDRRCFW